MPRCPTCHRRLGGGATCPDDGAIAPRSSGESEAAETPPPQVPGHDLESLLGVGGFAVVWAARRTADHPGPVAVKITRDRDERSRSRMEREAAAMAAIGASAVPALHHTGRLDDGRSYLIMERLTGEPLAGLLETVDRPPELGRVWSVIREILARLSEIHHQGLIHRDLKPENIHLVSRDPVAVRLIDLGLARRLAPSLARAGDATDPLPEIRPDNGSDPDPDQLTRDGAVIGTAEYMAPEQLRPGAPLDVRTDLYAVGVIAYELFALRPPFVGDRASIEHGHLSLRPPRLRQLAAVPEPVEEVIMTCLAKDPARRPASAEDLASALARAWQRGRPGSASRLDTARTSLLEARRQPVVLLVIDADAPPDRVAAEVGRHGGFVARQRGQRHVCAFSGLANDDPVQAALATAREFTDPDHGRAALHLTRLSLRRKRRGPPAVIGSDVEKPEIWLPERDWSGLITTGALARSQPEGATRPAAGLEGFFVWAPDDSAATASNPLIGRDELMATIERELHSAMSTRTPGLVTLLAAPGLGKSRLARAIAARVRAVNPGVRVVSTRASRTTAGRRHDADARIADAVDAVGLGAATLDRPTVIILDDAHWASSPTLDRLEYATLDHGDTPLLVVVLALPRMADMRGRWGSRANRHHRETLGPLDPDDARQLAAKLLQPADYPPAGLLERLAHWSGGSPHLLTGLIAELKRRGVVHRHAHGDGWQVATAEIDKIPAQAAEQWLATRLLDEMPPELAACVRLCAVLGAAFSAEELAHVQDAVEEHGGAGSPVDADVGLAQLVAHGTLRHIDAGDHAFTSPAFQDAVYALVAGRDRKTLHRYAAGYWHARLARESRPGDDTLERFARHASACGQESDAAAAYLTLGERARQAHQHVSADHFYTAALRYTGARDGHPDDAPSRAMSELAARALVGRGRARYLVHRVPEAMDDLREARKLADAIDRPTIAVDALLEHATAADWGADWDTMNRCVAEAATRLEALDDPGLHARLAMARGRDEWRAGRVASAIELLTDASRRARAVSDPGTEMLARLLLAPALVWHGQLKHAEQVFRQAVEQCQEMGDRVHLCGLYANRMFLWAARKQPERAEDDLRRAIRLAREVGNPVPERAATHNLAELLFRSGEQRESLTRARRSRVLQERFWQNVPEDALLLARIHAARGEFRQSHDLLEWVRRECDRDTIDPIVLALLHAVQLVVARHGHGAPDTTWDPLIDRARESIPAEELIEVLWWRARCAIDAGQWDEARGALDEAMVRLDEAPVWSRRLELALRQLPGR